MVLFKMTHFFCNRCHFIFSCEPAYDTGEFDKNRIQFCKYCAPIREIEDDNRHEKS